MSKETNMFQEPKLLKKWAIQLANACGGQRVEKTNILNKLNTKQVNILLDEFVLAYNHNVNVYMQDKVTEEE